MEMLSRSTDWYSRAKAYVKKNSAKIALIATIAYIVAFAIYLFVRTYDIGLRYHEIDSYALPVISIQYRGSFVIHSSDLVLAQRDFPHLYEGINTWEDLRSTKPMKSSIDENIWIAYYFPIYSLVCIPVKLVLQLFKIPMYNCFLITNVLLVIIAFVVIALCSKMPRWYRLAYIVLLSLSPLEQYTTYLAAEIMMFSFMAMAIMFYHDKAYCRAGILVSLTSMANPTVLLFGLVMIANYIIVEVVLYYKNRKDLTAKQICWQGFWKLARLGVCYLIVFIPFIINFIHLKVANGTFGGAEFGMLYQRLLMYLFDLNMGYFSFAPLLLIITVALLPVLIVKKKYQVIWYYLSFFVTVFALSIMVHINCGMFYCARYVIWSYTLLAFAFIAAINQIKARFAFKSTAFAACAISAIVLMGINSTQNTAYTHLNRVSQFVLDNAPALYSPMHSSFYSRTINSPYGGYQLPPSVVYYDSDSSHIRKILLHGNEQAKAELLAKYPAVEGDKEGFIKAVNSVPNDNKWHYINIAPSSDYQVRVKEFEFGIEGLGVTSGSTREEGKLIIQPNGAQFGPYLKLATGEYVVAVYGSNLLNASYDIAYNKGAVAPTLTEMYRADNVIIYKAELKSCGWDTDFRTYNRGAEQIELFGFRVIRFENESEVQSIVGELCAVG